jgi:hypothetical protein
MVPSKSLLIVKALGCGCVFGILGCLPEYQQDRRKTGNCNETLAKPLNQKMQHAYVIDVDRRPKVVRF